MRSHIRVVPPLLWHFKLQGSSGGHVLKWWSCNNFKGANRKSGLQQP